MRETQRAQVEVSKQRKERAFQIEPSKIVDGGQIKAIFDPWQRSLFSRQRTPGKEPLLAGNRRTGADPEEGCRARALPIEITCGFLKYSAK